MKKFIAKALVLVLILGLAVGCTNSNSGGNASSGGNDSMYISVVSKGFQHQFWQAVKAGSDAAAKDLNVTVFFTGPEGESALAAQVDMINQELAKNPAALCLAALDTNAVMSQLKDAQDKNIPVIGFDSGVPDAPAGQVKANASTDNESAAAVGADHMFDVVKDQITGATGSDPVVIAILSQDATSASITGRTRGFALRMAQLAEGVNNSVAIEGDLASINKGDSGAAVKIRVIVGATTNITDMANSANGMLNIQNLIGIFCSNEGAVNGLLAAVNAGSRIPGGVQVVGFDAGESQKAAVKNGMFLGSVTQDPFQIGYKAVELAVKAVKGEAVSDVDTGAKWYDASNMDQADIALLLYD